MFLILNSPVCRDSVDIGRLAIELIERNSCIPGQIDCKTRHRHRLQSVNMQNAIVPGVKHVDHLLNSTELHFLLLKIIPNNYLIKLHHQNLRRQINSITSCY